MEKQEIVYFSLNNWFPEDDYPNAEPFISWLGDDLKLKFLDENWVKENKLCVLTNIIDMSVNFRITATKEWVDKNCPELLTKYTEFIVKPNKDNELYDRFGCDFAEYAKENFGVRYTED